MICVDELRIRPPAGYLAVMDRVVRENIAYLVSQAEKQEVFAEEVGVTQGTVSRWLDESKPMMPGPDKIRAMAERAGVPMDTFIGVPHTRWKAVSALVPSEEELTEMLLSAQRELPAGLPFSEWPRAVAAALHTRLAQLAGDRTSDPDQDDS